MLISADGCDRCYIAFGELNNIKCILIMPVGENVKSSRTERLFGKMALEIRYDRHLQELF